MAEVGIKLTAADQTQTAFATVKNSLAGLQNSAAGVNASLASLGVGISIGGFIALTKAAIDSMDALNDIKDATGASIENISALEDIAKRTGTSFDTVGSALTKLNQSLNNAKADSPAAQAIERIGLSVKDLKQLDPAEAFQKVAVALSGFADDGNKARLSQELFGKSLKEIAPLLNDVAEAGTLVATVTAEQAAQAEKFNKQMFALQATSAQTARTFATELLPSLISLNEEFATGIKVSGGLFQALADFGTINPFRSTNGNLQVQREDLASLTEDLERFQKIGANTQAIEQSIATVKRKIEFLKQSVNSELVNTFANVQSAAETARLSRGSKVKASVGNLADTTADKAAASAYNAELKKQADLLNTLSGVNADYQESLTRLQAIKATGRIGDEKYVELVNQLIEKQPMVLAQRKQEAEVDRARIKSLDEYVKAQEKALEAQQQSATTAAKELQRFEDEEKALVIAAEKHISLAQAIAEVELARLRETQTKALAANADGATLLALQQEIEAREKIAKAIGRKDGRDAATQSAKDAATEWKRAADQIEQSITDALFRGFESGKGFIENLRDTIVNTFKTMVLKPIISGIVSPVAGAAAGALGFSGAANAAGSVGSLAGAGGLAALGGTFASSLSAGFTATLSAGFTGLGASLSGGLSAIATGSASSIAAGLGQIAGTLGPFALAAVGIAGLLGAFKGEYAKSTGDANASFDANGLRTQTLSAAQIGGGRYEATLSAGADKLVIAMNAAYLSSVKALGVKASGTDFFYGGNNSDGGKFTLGAGVGGVGGVFNSGEQKLSDEAVKLAAARAVFAAVQSSDLPVYLSKVFDGITASTASQTDIDAALQYAGGLKQIRDALTETRTPLQVLQDTVNESFATLSTSAATFKTDFVAAIDAGIGPDKLAAFVALGNNLDSLAAAAGKASDGVRTLADIANERTGLQNQLDQLTLSGTQLLAKQRDALDASNQSLFDQVQAATAAKDAQATLAEAERDRLAQRVDLQDQLDQLTLSGTQLLAKQRDALDESNRALFDQVQAATAAKDAQITLAEAERARLTERTGLQNQLDQLTLSGTQLLAKQRDALDESNRALFDQVQAATAAKDAQSALAAASEAMAQRVSSAINSLGDTRFSLENQVLTLQGNTGEVAARTRANDLAKFTEGITSQSEIDRITAAYDYNTSLKAQVEALTASKAAAEEAARAQQQAAQSAAQAADTIRSAMESITTSIFNEVQRIRGITSGNTQQDLASARAQFTIANAQANAGDQNAAKLLPTLSQALLTIADANATTLDELRRIQAQTAAALAVTGTNLAGRFGLQVPFLDSGTNYVPEDMLIVAHKGEAVVPQAFNADGFGGGSQVVLAVNQLGAQLAIVQIQLDEIALQTTRTATATNGNPEQIAEVIVVPA